MMRIRSVLSVFAGSLFVIAALQAAESGPKTYDAALRALAQKYIDAWNRSDAEGIASQFVNDGDLITPDGVRSQGHAAIRAFYAAAFQQGYSGSRAGMEVVAIRAIGRDVIIADGTWFIENARTETGTFSPREQGIATLVAVRTKQGWRVSAVREQTSATAIRTPNQSMH